MTECQTDWIRMRPWVRNIRIHFVYTCSTTIAGEQSTGIQLFQRRHFTSLSLYDITMYTYFVCRDLIYSHHGFIRQLPDVNELTVRNKKST